jgi:hypothetical protein
VSNHLKETEVVISVNNDKVVNVVSPETKFLEAIRNKYMSAENLLAAVSDTKVEVKQLVSPLRSVGSSVGTNSLLSSVEKIKSIL